MIEIFSAFGLSAATGLNAYLPLLIVGVLARFTDLISLKPPWNTLAHPGVLVVLAVLLVIEMLADKIPIVDSINDMVQTFVRPAAGAILFAAAGNVISEISPVLAMICGLLVAGGVHAAKSTTRPTITASTAGLGNPVLSILEDLFSGVVTFISIFLPVLIAIAAAALLGLWGWSRIRRYCCGIKSS